MTPLLPSTRAPCPGSSECCPQSIRITGRLQSEQLAAFVGIRIILHLIAIVFSIIATANGKNYNYASRHTNIKAMLNTCLNFDPNVQVYALIIEYLLRLTCLHPLLEGTVGQHIARAKAEMEGNLCLDFEPEWDIMRVLVPEVFNSLIRDELEYLDALPGWAASPLKIEEPDDSDAR